MIEHHIELDEQKQVDLGLIEPRPELADTCQYFQHCTLKYMKTEDECADYRSCGGWQFYDKHKGRLYYLFR